MSEAGYRLYEKETDALMGAKPTKFAVDTHVLKSWLLKRRQSMKDVRSHFEPLWKEIRLYFEPNLGKALLDNPQRDQAASKREDDKILNSEPRLCVHRYAAGMQSGITNKAQQWCAIVPKLISEEESESPELNAWCNTATTEILSALERANFYRTSQNVYPHGAVFGTSCVLILRGEAPGDVFFHLIDEGDYWIAEDRYGNATTLMRRLSFTIEQVREQFMLGNLPQTWREKTTNGRLEDRVEIWNIITPNTGSSLFEDVDASRPYVSIYWTDEGITKGEDNDGILEISSFSYRPMAILRQNESGSAYGKGIGEMSLADNKELQTLEEYELRMIANEAEPAMTAPTSMKGKAINMFPGGITFYDGVLTGNSPITRLFETREGIDKVDAKVQMIEDRIRRHWYNDLFAMMLSITQGNRTQKTATEVSELSGEKVTLLGPVLTQMDEFLNSIIDAVFRILLEDGVIPPPPEALVEGVADISVEYTSTIHSEMKAALKMRAINTILQIVAMVAQMKPDVVDKVDIDKIINKIASVYPGAAEFIREDEVVAAIRQARTVQEQQAVAQQQMAEMAKTAGQNVKALSEARVGNGNALEAIMGALQ